MSVWGIRKRKDLGSGSQLEGKAPASSWHEENGREDMAAEWPDQAPLNPTVQKPVENDSPLVCKMHRIFVICVHRLEPVP